MGTFIILLIISYLIYYTSIIIYDLRYAKKEEDKDSDGNVVFQPDEMETDENTLQNIDIEDVETIVSKDFDNESLYDICETEERVDIDKLRDYYEEESKEEAWQVSDEAYTQKIKELHKASKQRFFNQAMFLSEADVVASAGFEDGSYAYNIANLLFN